MIKSKRIISFFSNLLDPHIKKINDTKCDLVIFPTQDDNSFKIKSKSLTTIWDLMHIYEGQFAEYSNRKLEEIEISKHCSFCSSIIGSPIQQKNIFYKTIKFKKKD